MTSMRRYSMLRNIVHAAVCPTLFFMLLPNFSASQDAHNHAAPEKLGTVTFPTTCKPAVQKEFERGIALLHSFAYSSAGSSFRNVAGKDPNCAMAHWGIAMTYFHQLWDPPIRPDGFQVGR